MPNKGHQASQTLAAEQARKKSAELGKVGVLSNSESSPERGVRPMVLASAQKSAKKG